MAPSPKAPTPVQQVTRSFLKLGAGELLARALSFITIIILARRLGAASYGIVGFANAVLMYFIAFTDFGIEFLGPRDVAFNPEAARKTASRALVLRVAIGCVLGLGLAGAGMSMLSGPDGVVLALYALILLPTGASTRWVHIGLEQAGRVALARVLGEALRALIVVLLVTSAASVLWAVAAHVIGEALTALVLLALLRGWLQWGGGTFASATSMLRRASPLAVTAVLGLVIYNSDLVLLRVFRDAETVGIYLAAFSLIALLGNLANTYANALLPSLTRADIADGTRADLYSTAMAHVVAVATPVTIGGVFLAPQIIELFFTAEYEASGLILQILMVSVFFVLLRAVLRIAFITTDRQRQDMWIATASAALSLALNLLAIPRFGAMGAAVTTVVTEIARTILSQAYVRRAGFPAVPLRRFWRTAVAAAVMLGVFVIAGPQALGWGLSMGIAAYLIPLALTGGIRFRRGALPELHV